MTPHVSFDKAGDATLLSLEGELCVLRAAAPAPPGARLEGRLSDGAALRVKVHSCKRDHEQYLVTVRLIDVTREVRERLVRLLAPCSSGT